MSDSLRDRIAAAIDGVWLNRPDDRWEIADAVIAELNLTREEPNQAWLDAGLPNRHRYVTDWRADE